MPKRFVVMVLACLWLVASMGAAPAFQTDALTEEDLANTTYISEWPAEGIAPLIDGEYTEQYDPDAEAELTITLSEFVAFGDLNDDGAEDAVVVLIADPGGEAVFYELAAVLNEDGTPTNVATKYLGDRIDIKNLTIANGDIELDMVTQGPEDPMCCPTQEVLYLYTLQGETLVQAGGLFPHTPDGERYGYVDLSGQFVIEPQFDFAASFSEGLAVVEVDRQTGYIDVDGNYVVEPQFDFGSDFSEGLAAVVFEGLTGYITPEGDFAIEPQFGFGLDFSEGAAAINMDGLTGYIDPDGTVIIEPQYEFGSSFSEGLAAVGVDGLTGYINQAGEMIIEPQYDFGADFSEGLAAVSLNEQTGYIDRDDELVIEPQFDSFAPFEDGIAYATRDSLWGYIDRTGRWLFQLPLPDFTGGLVTSIVPYLPVVPPDSQAGACFSPSLIVELDTAYRCSLDEAEPGEANLFDPCLVGADMETIVCGTDPVQGDPGFALELTEPLPEPEPTPSASAPADAPDPEALANATYQSALVADGLLPLTDGEYERDTDEARVYAALFDEDIAYGDIDGDGTTDAAVLLATNTGGSGIFVELFAMLNTDDGPEQAASVLLGDRVQINSVQVQPNGEIVVDMVTQGPNDPQCCPTLPLILGYVLEGDNLVVAGTNVWLLQTASGATCQFATGATGVVAGERINYSCDDGEAIIGDLTPGSVWTARKGEIEVSDADEFTVTEAETVDLITIWQPVNPFEAVEDIGLTLDDVSLDPGELADTVNGRVVPGRPYQPNAPAVQTGQPPHLRYMFDEAVPQVYFTPFERQVLVYPVGPYQAIYNLAGLESFNTRLAALETLLDEQPPLIMGEIPVLNEMGAAQVIAVQPEYVEFEGGQGIRFVTFYAQDVGPIVSDSLFYTFQGLTDDNQYYIAAYYPVETDLLPATYEDSEAAENYEMFARDYESYLRETEQQLNEADPTDFSPDLSALDALLESLEIGP